MRKTSQLFAVLLVALLMASCSSHEVKEHGSWVADEAEIRSLLQGSADAWNRNDLTGHLAFYDQNVTFMTQNGPRPGVAAIEEAFKKSYFLDGHPAQSLRFEQVAIRPLTGDAALATGRFVLFGGGKPEQTGWFTLVWVRDAGGWRAVHDHSS